MSENLAKKLAQETIASPAAKAIAKEKELKKLAVMVNKHHEAGEVGFGKAKDHFRECGRALCAAKELVPHGEWLTWLANHFPFTTKTASNYMRLHKEWETLGVNSQSLSDFLDAVAKPSLEISTEEKPPADDDDHDPEDYNDIKPPPKYKAKAGLKFHLQPDGLYQISFGREALCEDCFEATKLLAVEAFDKITILLPKRKSHIDHGLLSNASADRENHWNRQYKEMQVKRLRNELRDKLSQKDKEFAEMLFGPAEPEPEITNAEKKTEAAPN